MQLESVLERLRNEKAETDEVARELGRKWAAGASYRRVHRVAYLSPEEILESDEYLKHLAEAVFGFEDDVPLLISNVFDGEAPSENEAMAFVQGVDEIFQQI